MKHIKCIKHNSVEMQIKEEKKNENIESKINSFF